MLTQTFDGHISSNTKSKFRFRRNKVKIVVIKLHYYLLISTFKTFGAKTFKETRSVTMIIFRKKYFLFKSFVKIELSYIFTINIVNTAESCKEK